MEEPVAIWTLDSEQCCKTDDDNDYDDGLLDFQDELCSVKLQQITLLLSEAWVEWCTK